MKVAKGEASIRSEALAVESEPGQAHQAAGGGSGPAAQGEREGERESDSFLDVINSYLKVMWRRKWVMLVIFALTVGAGVGWLQRQVSIYRASAKVIIDYNPPKVYQTHDVVELGSSQGYRGQLTYFETQFRIIRSDLVATMVLNREGLWNDPHLLGFDRNPELTEAQKEAKRAAVHQPSLLAGRVQVRPVPNSMMVQVEFEDSDPAFAQRIANAFARAYMDQNVLYKGEIVSDALRDLEKSLVAKRGEVERALQARVTFERENNMGSVEVSKEIMDDRMKTLEGELTTVRTDRIRLEARWKELSGYAQGADPFRVRSKDILESDVIRLLKTQIAQGEAALAALKTKYLDQHPDVLAKEEEITKLRAVARQEVQNLAQSVKNQLVQKQGVESGLTEALAVARGEQGRVGLLALEYGRLKDNETQLKQTEDLINRRFNEMRESSKFEINNVRLLDEATLPFRPVAPRRMLILAATVLLGLGLAISAAFIADYADSTVKDWRDLEDRLGQKVLGVVPVIGSRPGRHITPAEQRERDLHIFTHPTSEGAEASRSLRTNLLFMARSRKLDSLLITSASPSEGKSMMACHVATSVATSGVRVLLVEADMRRPRLAASFQLKGNRGLSTALVGSDPLASYVQATEVPNLDVLPCGPIPPNPAELLHTQRFTELLAEMRGHYDTLIFDSAPLLPVADSLVLAQRVDGVLLVVRAGQTSRHAVRHAVRSLSSVSSPILGVVLNYQIHKRHAGYGYGYGYGYRYAPYGAPAQNPKSSS